MARAIATQGVGNEGRTEPWRLRWGAIFGGTFVALGLWALLYVFGLAIGLSSVDAAGGQLNFPGLFTGIWAVVTPLIALFVGGLVAARTAGAQDRGSGAIHGLVLWGFATLLGAFALYSVTTAVIGGVASLGGSAASAAGGANPAGIAQSLNINSNELLQPINQKLQEGGHATITANQLEATVQDASGRMLQQGRVDRGIIEQSLVANTNLDQQSVREISGDLEQQFNSAMGQVEQTAATVAEGTGTAMWGVFFALLLGLVSAVLGALVGTSRKQVSLANAQRPAALIGDDAGRPPSGTTDVTATTRRGEVYP